ncbi:MAG TPA: TolC family protein [Acidisarcina sp.]
MSLCVPRSVRRIATAACLHALIAGSLQGFAVAPSAVVPGASMVDAPGIVSGASSAGLTIRQPDFKRDMPRSFNFFKQYRGVTVPQPDLVNSPRLEALVHDGKLYLSLQDAISLALENNLDLEIARYNTPIADADILRTRAGGQARGVNTGVVQGTPGGGEGGFGSGAPGAGAGGTTGGAGGAGAGASGLVESTLGTGSAVSSYDPLITGQVYVDHSSEQLTNQSIYGVPDYKTNTILGNFSYLQAFPSGTSLEVGFDNNRQTVNSVFNTVNPQLYSNIRLLLQQQLLSGFGLGPNLRYLHIAKNNKLISDIAFRAQVIATVTQIEDIYWDLVSAYDDETVKEGSLNFAQQTLDNNRKQLELQAIPAMDVMKAESEVAVREQDLTISRTALQLQELLVKNALTKTLDDPRLEEMPVVPTDRMVAAMEANAQPMQALIAQALGNRTELKESVIDLANRQLSRSTARNALLPTVSLYGFYSGTGYGGQPNAQSSQQGNVTLPPGYGGALLNAFNASSPEYQLGLQMEIPLRNRIAKADQYRTELEYRQSQLYQEELKKRIRIEVRNAEYAFEQGRARVDSATKSRDLAQKTFEIMKQEQQLGAGSSYQTLTSQRDLAVAESTLVAAKTNYAKAKVELDRATGVTLEANAIDIREAQSGGVARDNPRTGP